RPRELGTVRDAFQDARTLAIAGAVIELLDRRELNFCEAVLAVLVAGAHFSCEIHIGIEVALQRIAHDAIAYAIFGVALVQHCLTKNIKLREAGVGAITRAIERNSAGHVLLQLLL